MFHFSLILHAHQPLGNFEDVMETSYRLSYLPFLEVLSRHRGIALTMHYSGSLLEWIEKSHPEYFTLLRDLVGRGQVELLGGGYYEPILISIPDRDKRAQLDKLSGYLERHFGAHPKGIWLTERVWEPDLPEALAAAGIAYTLTDDAHFLYAGLEPESLYGDYLTESNGASVRVIPGVKDLRYFIPFRDVSETVDFLHAASAKHPGGLAAMGDDLEKFGVWPETNQHVYGTGWLERFFTALEAQSSWLRVVRASDYLDAHPPLGRVYLPTASYQEMMEWSLPNAAGASLDRVRHRIASLEDGAEIARFLRGGLWNNFFHKYSEANLLHKRMQWVSRGLANLPRRGKASEAAYDALLAGQCNDAYWHGVFGGLYAPHLRHALYANLVRASRHAIGPPVTTTDFDLDGRPELVLESPELFAVLDPGDGATVAELDFRPGAVNVVNSLMRRPENYHDKLRNPDAHSGAEAKSIHDRVRMKEPGLEKLLIYDKYERSCFRAYLFRHTKTLDDFVKLDLGEDAAAASGTWDVDGLVCARGELRKSFVLSGNSLCCKISGAAAGRLGLEMVFNLMAPNAHDRYFEAEGLHEPLRWQGEIARAGELWLKDWYMGVAIRIVASPAAHWWIAPIHTVSQSEDGFEKVYQGSMILPWWETSPGFEGEIAVELSRIG